MKQKIIRLLVLAISLSLILGASGCGPATEKQPPSTSEGQNTPGGTDAQKPIVLTVWAWDRNLNVACMETAEEFYKKNHPNVSLNIVEIGSSDVSTKLSTALATKSTDTLPDITLMEDYYAQKFLSLYADMYVDLTDIMPIENFAKSKIASGSFNGRTYWYL